MQTVNNNKNKISFELKQKVVLLLLINLYIILGIESIINTIITAYIAEEWLFCIITITVILGLFIRLLFLIHLVYNLYKKRNEQHDND